MSIFITSIWDSSTYAHILSISSLDRTSIDRSIKPTFNTNIRFLFHLSIYKYLHSTKSYRFKC